MIPRQYVLSAVVALIMSIIIVHFGQPRSSVQTEKETSYERVMRTGTLRCGYGIIGLGTMKDPNTGELSGTVYEIVEAIGKELNLKIDWAEEVPFKAIVEGLKTDRYDAVCVSIYARPNFMPHTEMTAPYYFVPINAYKRVGDDRFKTKADIDKPEIKVSYQDGTIPAYIRAADFPNSGGLSLTDTEYSDIMMGVTTGKADVTFVEPAVAQQFIRNNPNQLDVVNEVSPLRVFPAVLAVKKGEHDLETMLSGTIRYLVLNGTVEKILQKYEQGDKLFLRASTGYKE
ncbi:MAG: transporter substrate-binding domain-containing protein [Alphaproteobacteria bacterium]|nr:transporter substrate-binding domain-containing protein [Alphaproteobacteria bacterium]